MVAVGPASGMLVGVASHWAATMVSALEAHGIVKGDEFGRFFPDEPMTRAQMAKLMVASLGYEADAELLASYPSRYGDVPQWHWARGYVESLAEIGVTEGYPGNLYAPDQQVTRAQLATFLVRAAGLTEQARLMNFNFSTYSDDKSLPAWARGSINAARVTGLMTGFDDGSFRPDQAVTRAEGATTIYRFLERRGALYHLSGTLVQFDPATGKGTVRDALGTERTFRMAADAQYMRAGLPAQATAVRRFDQVWVVLNENQQGRFMEARTEDLLGTQATVEGGQLKLTAGSNRWSLGVQAGALITFNGKPAALTQVAGATEIYVMLDALTQEARVIYAVNAPIRGQIVDRTSAALTLVVDDEIKIFPLAQGVVVMGGRQVANVTDLQVDDQVRLGVNEAGLVTYVEAER